MIKITAKEHCSGCSACAAVCPRQCITMQPDEEGFLYPQVDTDACVNCGLCSQVCPVSNRQTCKNGTYQGVYAAINPDHTVRAASSSGGVFTLLAQYVLSRDGIVFGAATGPDMKICHIGIEDAGQLHRLQGSKYAQSDPSDIFRQVKNHLLAGKLVLYTGTPCQIGGLQAFLGKDYENLLCQDIICHGVPSPAVWARYVRTRQQKAGAAATSVSFRDKASGWYEYGMKMTFEDGSVYQMPARKDSYLRAFTRNLTLRPSCYACAFKGVHRSADFTLADFWGVNKVLPEMYDNKGTSLVFIHSPKGLAVFEALKDQLQLCPADPDAAVLHNSAMHCSAPRPANRDAFWETLQTADFEKTVARFCPLPPLHKRLLKKCKAVVKKILRK